MLERHMRRSVIFSEKLQILSLVFSIVLLALLISSIFPSAWQNYRLVIYTATECIIASLAGVYLLGNVRKYPGVEDTFYVIPSFCVSYGGLILVLVLARIPYSRLLLISSFVISVIISIGYVIIRRRMKLRIGVVPIGEYARLIETPGVDWHLLESSDVTIGLNAVSVDLWCDLPDEWERELASLALRGIPVYHSKHLLESLTGKVEIERLSENNFGTLSPLYAYMTVKHIADWVAALAALVLLSPFLLLTAVLIRLDSPGPVIFRQIRIGYQGRPFQMLKFRTMKAVNTSADRSLTRDSAMTKDNDQRITRTGKFLRHSRLDELPQLFNILKGEMSWIGPRPEADVLSRWYESEIPFYPYRHIVRPGITGWAQVHQGHVADVDQVKEKLHFDFYYIKNFSLWIDIIVTVRTIRTMLTGFGSR